MFVCAGGVVGACCVQVYAMCIHLTASLSNFFRIGLGVF